jgi:RNA polymerase sigma-70 factor (ECF subfamily)
MMAADLEDLRSRGFAVAYRMLGSVADAEDVVQEALLRFTRADEEIREPAAWITTVATRLAIDHLRLARVRRESYVGPWLPEPLLEDPTPGPADAAELADTLSQAFLVLLEQLTPVERAAFLLREVFGYEYAQVAEVVDRSEPAARQLVTRARRHLEADRPHLPTDPVAGRALLQRFLAAVESGDLEALEGMLAEDAVIYSDGGGKVVAARKPVVGARRGALFMARIARSRRRDAAEYDSELVMVNGLPGRALWRVGEPVSDVLSIEVADGRIQTVLIVRNPDKLGHLAVTHERPDPS